MLERLRSIPTVEVLQADCRDDALAQLQSSFFDLVILDLTIPTTRAGLDAAREHGQEVFYAARKHADGTPVRILTGSEPDGFCLGLAKYGQSVDLWGSGVEIPTISYLAKEEAVTLVQEIEALSRDLARTDEIGIDTWGRQLSLSPEDRRALRAFTRRYGGVSCTLRPFGSGLSDASVFRLFVLDERGHNKTVCVAKLGDNAVLQTELTAFESVTQLRMGSYTPLLQRTGKGLRGRAAIFYALADGYDRSLFDVIRADPKAAAQVVRDLRGKLARWTDAKYLDNVRISEIRRRLLSDAKWLSLCEKFQLQRLQAVEDLPVRVHRGCIHGDLHCGNILVDAQNSPVLIDFGDVGAGFSCLDPVSLELSLIFHRDAVQQGTSGQFHERLRQWPDIDAYTHDSTLGECVVACRDWAHEVAGSDAAVLAAGYAYTLRQLKYDDVEPALTMTLLDSIVERLLTA